MLSIENPPPDPPCPCQVPLLNNPSFDERASTSHTLAFSEVDLQSKNPPPPSPPPNFSIREYVFKARSKNIQTNWPFSVKNLQLCLKHGVKDLLPPFQHPDTVRTQLSNRCKVEAKSLSKRSISNWERREQPSSRPNSDLPSFDSDVNSNSHRDTVASCKDISSLKSGGEDDNPLITTSAVSGSQIEPVSTSRQPSSVVETDTLVESSVRKDKEATSRKAVSTSQPSGKKCRLIVKFGGKCERSSTEDISSNCTSISEAMASKVCPVCKTFSSSSNTTLNAHIDQCLSIESSPKQAADKLIRPRIKPRKIKLMADIYLKAPRCTLEELDRRNGSNWAGVSCLPRDAEPTAEGKKKTSSVVNGDGANDAGAVYIDANGTKLRILSKFNDAPLVPQVQDDLGLKRSLRGSKGRKAFAKKRRLHGSKHHKYLKVSSKGKKIHPRKAHELQVTGNHKKQNTLQEGSVGSQRQISRSQGLMKPGDSGSLRTWASSKRTGLAKKAATRDFPPPRCHLHLAQNLLVESGQPCLGNNLTMDGGLQKSTCLSDQQMNEGKEKTVDGTQMTDETEQSPGRKGLGSMLDGRTGDITERSLPPAKRKFRKDNSLGDDGSPLLSLLDNSEHCSLQPVRNKKLGLHASPDSDYGISRNMSVRSLRNSRAFSRKALRFSTLRKRVLSLCQSPEMNSKSNRIEKCSHFEKSNMLLAREMGEKVAALQPKLQRRYEVGLDPAEHQSAGEDSLDDMSFSERMIGQERGERSPLHREEATAFRSTPSASDCFDDIEGENMQSSFAVCARLPQRIDGIKSNPNEVNNDVNGANVPSALAMEDASWGLSRYFSSEYDNHMNSRFKTHSQRLLGTSKASLFTDGEEFSNAEDDDNCATEQNGNDRIDEDSEDGQASSFPEIDPIPIPGPPGSFLPSPGAMGSEDFQGNSSLTTSQVHSSQEQQDLVDGDSSDSPVSATSTISNSAENRVDVDCSERVVPHEHQNSSWSGFLGTCNEPSVNDVAATAQASTEVVESNAEDAEKSRVGNRFIKKGPLFSTIDDQPCCCQRKERLSQNIALSYRESPHTNRRMVAPLAVPGMMGKQFGRSPYAGLAQLEGRPETLNPAGYMSTKSERSSSPTIYSSRDPVSSPDDRFNCPGRGDCDLASPSASNPILRLMGKDLVVVNKEEDASVPLGQSESQSGVQKNNLSPQFSLYSGVLSAGGQNQKYGLSDHLVIQGSKIMREDLNGMGEPHFGAGAVGSSISFMNSKTVRVPPSSFATPQRLVDGFTEAQDYNGGYSSSTLCQPVDVPNAFTVHNQVRIVSFPETQPQKASSPGNLRKEIIVIDDAPENNEADLLKSPEILRDHMPLSRTFGCDPRQANSFFPPHQPQDPLYYSGYPADFSARSNANPVASSHNAKGLMPPQAAPFTAASSSRGHLRPGIVYYPSMS